MKRRMPLGDFLSGYLGKLGVRHLFGIPGVRVPHTGG